MFGQMHPTAMEQLVPTKRSYKKLGTILEHIAECINPYYYRFATQVVSHYPYSIS